jgi:ArsR family transcriptional regulator, arsenate/arsenite/antimonite-responsive transcriptional repressor
LAASLIEIILLFWKYKNMDQNTIIASLKALSQEYRLHAFRALIQAGPEGLSVGELRDILDIPPATLTAHLNILRNAGLVSDQREGRVIRVRADYARMDALIGYLTENCCAGGVCMPSANRSSC